MLMLVVTILVGLLLQTLPRGDLYKARLDVWPEHVAEQLAVIGAIVVVDVNLLHTQLLVVFYPLHGIAVLQSADGADGY